VNSSTGNWPEKQYSFWPGDRRLDAWDVDHLIELSRELPVREVPLDAIAEVDADYWYRYAPVPCTVRRVVEHMQRVLDADLSYPIILAADGRVMDGMHRVARAILDGRATIRAVQFDVQPEPDFRDCSPTDLPYERREEDRADPVPRRRLDGLDLVWGGTTDAI
jgi:hypothetical protein